MPASSLFIVELSRTKTRFGGGGSLAPKATLLRSGASPRACKATKPLSRSWGHPMGPGSGAAGIATVPKQSLRVGGMPPAWLQRA